MTDTLRLFSPIPESRPMTVADLRVWKNWTEMPLQARCFFDLVHLERSLALDRLLDELMTRRILSSTPE